MMRFSARISSILFISSVLFIVPAFHLCAIESSPAPSWSETLTRTHDGLNIPGTSPEARTIRAGAALKNLFNDFPVQTDWALQEDGEAFLDWLQGLRNDTAFLRVWTERALDTLPEETRKAFQADLEKTAAIPEAKPGFELYEKVCEARRLERLKPLQARCPRLVFTRHSNLGGSHYAYTEAQSDAQNERNFVPGSALCLFDTAGARGKVEVLLESPEGVIRDPDVSPDGKRLLFSWKKSDLNDDYHLYEMDIESRQVRQITEGLGFADYEGVYLPDGNLLFNSTRCVQIVDCWWTEVSNLYTCDANGQMLRRLTFDQVHDNFPQVLDDGRVVYTRWDYNDRGQIYPQGLFQMNPDGTGQSEFYGNNSWFPTTILHARGIPGTQKLMAIATGHHTLQTGKLIEIDPARGRQENSGVKLLAPERETPADRIDTYGQDGDQFQYPFPLDTERFLVSFTPRFLRENPSENRYGIYLMTRSGQRELLVYDPRISSNQAQPLAPRQTSHARPSAVNYAKDSGTFYIQNIYSGPGLKGVKPGTIKSLRVVALEFRPAGIGENGSWGQGGGALASTPVSLGNGSWDVKTVLGSARVHEDGSAFFTVPARTPLYFQALDEKGRAVQTMRSWSTLQPGENASCVGCHETKNSTPLASRPLSLAMRGAPQDLEPFYGPPRGFSFEKEIQPILDRHCIACHDNRGQRTSRSLKARYGWRGREFEHHPTPILDRASQWRYTPLSPGKGWEKPEFDSSLWSSGQGGFGQNHLEYAPEVATPWETRELYLRTPFQLHGDLNAYRLGFIANHLGTARIYLNGVLAAETTGYLAAYQIPLASPDAVKTLHEGENLIAVEVKQPEGPRYFDLAIVNLGTDGNPADSTRNLPGQAFSLRGDKNLDPVAKRFWSDSYLALTNACDPERTSARPTHLVNFYSAQTPPDMLPPYYAGSAVSEIFTLLEKEHGGAQLNKEEFDKLACWIDLGVPYCGDYEEANAWNEEEKAKYNHYLAKRRNMEARERENIRAYQNSQNPTSPQEAAPGTRETLYQH
ncbi:MAG TPA: hypothetical protein PKH31_02980 [Candidatus Sumerlaeota bacterium]|nr:hypothetical protein [Candidatus Sumerlaeota bacterium]